MHCLSGKLPKLIFTYALFILGLAWFFSGMLRLVHWSCNFKLDPTFVMQPYIWKSIKVAGLYLLGAAICLGLSYPKLLDISWSKASLIATFFTLVMLIVTTVWGRNARPDCDEVRRRMKESGVAIDAQEGKWFGKITVEEPEGGMFSPQGEQVSWWGRFNKPFEYWGEPELTANWFDPEGALVYRAKFKGEHCKLMKTTLKMEKFKPGLWRVEIDCRQRARLDTQEFLVAYPTQIPEGVSVAGVGGGSKREYIEIKKPK